MVPSKNKSLYQKYNAWANKKFSYPGITETDLIIKKDVWFGTAIIIIGVSIMTVIAIALNIPLIIKNNLIILLFVTPLFISINSFKQQFQLLGFITGILILLSTFYFILKLGGLFTSGGLMLFGIPVVILSISNQNKAFTAWLFVIYMLTLIATAFLQPRLNVPEEMTPNKNLILFILNFLWKTGLVMYMVFNYIDQRKKMAELIKREAKRLEEVDELKTKLYTNITHEFRTPLTVIQGMADQIKEHPDNWIKHHAIKIKNNSKVLLKLISQVLDYSKLEAKRMPVNLIQDDVLTYIKVLTDSYQSLARSKKLSLNFSSNLDSLRLDFDSDILLHIISNLVSNAINYTNEGGNISVNVEINSKKPNQYIIKVKDNGIGIKNEDIRHLFDRYYRVTDSSKGIVGTGLGLSITNEMVKLLNGKISVRSKYGKGTEFWVILPITNNAIIGIKENLLQLEDAFVPLDEYLIDYSETEINKLKKDLPILLIVEDNSDVVDYLRILLRDKYNLQIANNGKEGLEKAIKTVPDIILSDVMMPLMDGFEMLQNLKNDIRTSHIPVILLTAKADIRSKIEGLEYGADAYISKPFNKDELFVRLEKLIELRKNLQDRYKAIEPIPETEVLSIKKEDKFIQKLRLILEQNLDNDSYGIKEICSELGISRSQLYRKFKALTDTSIGSYIKSFRLHKAKELLTNTSLNVTEVAYDVGFKDLSHFSHSFFLEFGVNPSEINQT